MAKAKKKWIAGAIKRPGALRAKAKKAGALKDGIAAAWLAKAAKKGGRTGRQARMAKVLKRLPKRGRKGKK